MPSSTSRRNPLQPTHEMFDSIAISCYTIGTSPLFLREQGARRRPMLLHEFSRLCFLSNKAREFSPRHPRGMSGQVGR